MSTLGAGVHCGWALEEWVAVIQRVVTGMADGAQEIEPFDFFGDENELMFPGLGKGKISGVRIVAGLGWGGWQSDEMALVQLGESGMKFGELSVN